MGGAVSTGQDNDDLIDNLIRADYIRTHIVERVFRAVDRADYFLPEARGNAYKDLAWKSGYLHISAPCIYSEVMEGLRLSAGLSFLNLGSGTGYLSTMVGLILGSNGINHGVEIRGDVIHYANKKLEEFKKYSGAIDEFDFCEPKFIQGNCLCLTTDRLYDRVYCGAACPDHYEGYLKNLLRVGGILVMPLNDQLMQIKRTSDVSWEDRSLLPVSFATLITPPVDKQEIVEMLEVVPLSLQSLSRAVIRGILRKNIELENPNLLKRKKQKRKRRPLRKWLVQPIFNESGDEPFSSDEERAHPGRRPIVRRGTTENILDTVMDHLGYTIHENRFRPNLETDRPPVNANVEYSDDDDLMNEEPAPEINEARSVLNHRLNAEPNAQQETEQEEPRPEEEEDPDLIEVAGVALEGMFVNILQEMSRTNDAVPDDRDLEVERTLANAAPQQIEPEPSADRVDDQLQENMNNLEVVNTEPDNNKGGTSKESGSGSAEDSSSNKKREKFDSGLGEEIAEKDSNVQNSSENDTMDVDSSSSDDEVEERRTKRQPVSNPEVRSGPKWRRICLSAHRLDAYLNSSDSETVHEEPTTSTNESKLVQSSYTLPMRAKIQELPLPPILKNYLNFYREFN